MLDSLVLLYILYDKPNFTYIFLLHYIFIYVESRGGLVWWNLTFRFLWARGTLIVNGSNQLTKLHIFRRLLLHLVFDDRFSWRAVTNLPEDEPSLLLKSLLLLQISVLLFIQHPNVNSRYGWEVFIVPFEIYVPFLIHIVSNDRWRVCIWVEVRLTAVLPLKHNSSLGWSTVNALLDSLSVLYFLTFLRIYGIHIV